MNSYVTLNDGVKMPIFGLGVFLAKDGDETYNAVRWALEANYLHIDTAAAYKNEDSVGQAVKDSGIAREKLFITTKLFNGDQGKNKVAPAMDASLKKLKTDYVDLYLIHWPGVDETNRERRLESYEELIKLREKGKTRSIGVCNFEPRHLEQIIQATGVVPSVNQIELHPRMTQKSLQAFNQSKGIKTESWSPMMRGRLNDDAALLRIAEKYTKTVSQIILRWHIQQDIIIIPKSVHQERIIDNSKIFDFSLSDTDMAAIDSLNTNERIGPNPDVFSNGFEEK